MNLVLYWYLKDSGYSGYKIRIENGVMKHRLHLAIEYIPHYKIWQHFVPKSWKMLADDSVLLLSIVYLYNTEFCTAGWLHTTRHKKYDLRVFRTLFAEYGQKGWEKPLKIWASLVSCYFFLCNFALTWLEHFHHFLNFCDNFWFNEIWHWKYTILFGLTRCDVQYLWLLLSSVGGLAECDITVMHAISHVYGLITLAI